MAYQLNYIRIIPIIFLVLFCACQEKNTATVIKAKPQPKSSEIEITKTQTDDPVSLASNKREVPKYIVENYLSFIEAVIKDDKSGIAQIIKEYPVKRPSALLRNKDEFVSYYDKIFDKEFKALLLSKTSPDYIIKSESYAIRNGRIWFDNSGRIISITYKSKEEKETAGLLKQAVEENSHSSVRGWDESKTRFETEKFIIHIYYQKDKGFIYASWSKPKSVAEKPDLVLYEGEQEFKGTMGGIIYSFPKGNYKYSAEEVRLGPTGTNGWYLKVYQDDLLILEEKAIRVFE